MTLNVINNFLFKSYKKTLISYHIIHILVAIVRSYQFGVYVWGIILYKILNKILNQFIIML